MERVYSIIARRLVGLETKLGQAGIYETKPQFLKKVTKLAAMGAFGLTLFIFFLLGKTRAAENQQGFALFLLCALTVLFIVLFFYFLHIPDVIILKKARNVSKEIIFAGRFLIIELESGVPLYTAMKNVAESYESVGKYFNDVIHKVNLGHSMEEAIVDTVEHSPSNDLNRILWQILNSLKTGSDVRWSLNSVIDQIVREQQILVKEYGRKLNPLAMFYMMIAVIVPTLGTTMLTVLATFLNITVSLTVLLIIACCFALMQSMFVAILKQQRPPVEM